MSTLVLSVACLHLHVSLHEIQSVKTSFPKTLVEVAVGGVCSQAYKRLTGQPSWNFPKTLSQTHPSGMLPRFSFGYSKINIFSNASETSVKYTGNTAVRCLWRADIRCRAPRPGVSHHRSSRGLLPYVLRPGGDLQRFSASVVFSESLSEEHVLVVDCSLAPPVGRL